MVIVFVWRPCCMALLLLFLFPTRSLQQIGVSLDIYINCLGNTTTSLSSTFSRNLNTTLGNFNTLASQGIMHANITAGISGQDMVYAFFQCRGEMSGQTCGKCVEHVTGRLPQECPESVGARIRVDNCFLGYDNQSFFVLDTTIVAGFCNVLTASDDVATVEAISDLLENVTTEAPKHGGWASASAGDMFYAAAECLDYLSPSECAECLSTYSSRAVLSLCNSSVGMRMHLASCNFRYEDYNFLVVPPPSLNDVVPAPPLSLNSPMPAPAPVSLTSPMPAPAPVSLNNSAVPLSPPPTLVTPRQSPAGSKILVITLGSIGAIIGVIILCAILAWHYKGRKLIVGSMCASKEVDFPQQLLQTKAQVFSLEQLEESTEQFHPKNKLGEGGFGVVYKGTLSNKELVAIKKLSIQSRQGQKEFLNEVELITSVQHKNLIRLVGCCVQKRERILVYEYLPNRSLDFFLFGEQNHEKTLNWSARYGIILGMAKGLAYLHEESHIRIIHRDIKPSNILLDDQLNPVIADFGLARLVPNEDATIIHTRLAGTIGYLAPEYALHGDLSEKVDVFSFGIVTLEIVSGKRNLQSKLLPWVWELYLHEKILDLVDKKIGTAFSSEQVIRVVHAALLCTQENPKQRPTMSMVNSWLLGVVDIVEIPNRPLFLSFDDEQQTSLVPLPFTSKETASISGGVQSVSEIKEPR